MQYPPITEQVISHIKAQFDAEPEFLWKKTPTNAAIRHKENKKWFAALLLALPRKTLGLPGQGTVDVLNLKCDPLVIGTLLDGRRYLPGYHMNKEHWISVLLDGSAPLEEILPLIQLSYNLTDSAKPKKSMKVRDKR